MIRGSCLCGKCSYSAAGKLFDVLHCHCTNCRKLTGAAFSTYGAVAQQDFNWLCDVTNLSKYTSSKSVLRYVCNTCGSLLTSTDSEEKDAIYLSVGLFDTPTELKPEYHQFVDSKVSWYEITDSIPQFKHGFTG